MDKNRDEMQGSSGGLKVITGGASRRGIFNSGRTAPARRKSDSKNVGRTANSGNEWQLKGIDSFHTSASVLTVTPPSFDMGLLIS